jgi:DNA-binding GntR family transcriptional regulator
MTYGDRTRGETTKADGVYLKMRNQILYGVLEPGSRIDYGQLSASLGVSGGSRQITWSYASRTGT